MQEDEVNVDMPAVVDEVSTGIPETETEEVVEEKPVDSVVKLKDRLGRQQHKHNKELRSLHGKIAELESRITQPQQGQSMQSQMDQFSGQPIEPGSVQDIVQQSVQAALMAEHQKKAALEQQQKMMHVQKKYQNMQEDFDKAAMEHEDFDDVVRGDKAQFTEAMRDAALLIPREVRNDVLLKLGRNQHELQRIANLHPVDQAEEMIKLAIALGNDKKTQMHESRPLGQVKSSSISSNQSVNDQTSISELKKRIKGGWGRGR